MESPGRAGREAAGIVVPGISGRRRRVAARQAERVLVESPTFLRKKKDPETGLALIRPQG